MAAELADNLFDFMWQAPKSRDAYVWVHRQVRQQPGSEPQLVLATKQEAEEKPYYRPLRDEPALFLTFAHTPPTPEDLLRFANRYGRLGRGAEFWIVPDWGDRTVLPGNVSLWHGEEFSPDKLVMEPFAAWRWQVLLLNHLVTLRRFIRENNDKALRQFIDWKGKKVVRHLWPGPCSKAWRLVFPDEPALTETLIWDGKPDPDGKPMFQAGDVRTPALAFLQVQVDAQFRDLWSPRLGWDYRLKRPRLVIMPVSLIGCMYLQFAQALAGEQNFRRCAGCSRWYPLMPGANRADKLTCSTSCRVKVSRQRREQAIQLAAEGKKPAEIAKQVGSEVKDIKRWIAKSVGKK